jgi:hypothetical protein
MKKIILYISLLIIAVPFLAAAQQTVKEPSTEKSFPAEVKFKYADKDYSITLTGLTVRKKLFFKVYGMAHYMQDAAKMGNEADAFKQVLTDGKAKQITMDFARDVDAEKIKGAYTDGFKEHASKEELQKIQPMIDKFIGYFTKEVKENEQFILRWLPGGTVMAILQGEEKPAITNELFARTLWSIWFAKSSIVDRDDLVERIVGK